MRSPLPTAPAPSEISNVTIPPLDDWPHFASDALDEEGT
jgi:hypothetical protein